MIDKEKGEFLMKKSNPLLIKIENQRWLCNDKEDLCSHGEIILNVNGTIITQSYIDEEWGISESALALLRTLDKDYICDPDIEEGLILHGCGTILMMGCPISIHWTVKHIDGQVILSDFVKVTTTNPKTGSIYYPGLEIKLSKNEYTNQVVSFALQAKKLFDNSKEKLISDDFDKEMYEDFWDEYNQLLKSNSPHW
ncbi:hypothetical protein LIT32_25295 (plasmid) [Bacillus sp. CMF21]|uniref:hypothetical protein n=1 Tax=Metabacillus dongyingensis TaxID=2874282 RepID=UPI001FB3D6AA|nr:hypothetical protein [Metabacillus dongyingensis]UNJ81365.1 hypothetical protein [Metabacillus dongyingensis]USK31408.1 hypothetical protein LIT32_25295 [Bacillus sp. CMF21]